MVAGRDDDGHLGEIVVEGYEVVIEYFFDMGARLLNVEYVAADQQGVGMIGAAPALQLAEEIVVLVLAGVVLVHHLSQMEVGGVDKPHGVRTEGC